MKFSIKLFLVLILFTSCKPKIESADISKINGYWEIEKVVFEEGENKDYGVNQHYDYFQIDKTNTGFRKKVTPQLNGTFLVDDTFEKLKIRFQGDKIYIDYSTSFMKYSEELVELTDNELVLLNNQKKEYHYKRAAPINLLDDGKKAK